MFSQLKPSSSGQRNVLTTSIAMHALLLAWLLHTPDPRLLNPDSIANGHHGRVVSKLYFPTPTPDDSSTTSSDQASQRYRRQRLGHEKLILDKTLALAKLPALAKPLAPAGAGDDAQTPTLSKLGHGAPAGNPYGSVPGGKIYGDEIIPALPIATADPVVYPWQWPTSEGRVIIEITIDETGAIIRKTVLQSLGPEIDDKCLAALESWRFRPATQNGSPIPSKQDAIFPFKARG